MKPPIVGLALAILALWVLFEDSARANSISSLVVGRDGRIFFSDYIRHGYPVDSEDPNP